MLKVFYGPFHPDLENAFAQRLKELSANRQPIAVVAPSRRMAERLERLLSVEKNLALVDVHFHTFHSLAAMVSENSHEGKQIIADPGFHDRLVDSLLSAQPALGREFGGEGRPRALAAALRSSLRDLIDAGVSSESVEEFFGDKLPIPEEERGRLNALLRLAGAYQERLQDLGILSPSDLIRLAAQEAADCEHLRRFQEIIYYGFYDLTGLQLEFFEAVSAAFATRLYFPFRRVHPAFRFVENFFEQKLLAHESEPVARSAKDRPALDKALDGLFDPESKPVSEKALAVISASGARDEAWAAAKEILRLVEREGYAYEDVGVVVRTLEPYRSVIAEVFRENAIPFDMAVGEPLLRHPLAKTCLNLLTLREKDFLASIVEDILDSPYFRGQDLWRRIIRASRIHGGWLQWRAKFEKAQEARGLWNLISALEKELGLQKKETWSAKVGRAKKIIETHLCLPDLCSETEAAVWEIVQSELASLETFDLLGEDCDWKTFLEIFSDKLHRASLETDSRCRAVRVRDAMDARGESFKVLFLVGLKENLFPRVILEDPLLRDSARAALRHPAGYWIAQKASGHEEERLLFYLMASSAREKLYCVFPRSDESGRAEVPSLYLRELCRASGHDFSRAVPIPRQPAGKLEGLDPQVAAPQELFLRQALEGRSAEGSVPEVLGDARLHDEVVAAASCIGAWGKPGPWDGLSGPAKDFLSELDRRGISPSALDSFATCPFQFFASRVLGLGEPDETFEKGEFPRMVRGKIYHEILEGFYGDAEESLWQDNDSWRDRLQTCAAAVFAERHWKALGIYPLLWRAVQQAIMENLQEFLVWDIAEARETGFKPVSLERELRGGFKELPGLGLHGIVDRIDRSADGSWRVIDYKTRWTRSANLRNLAKRGELHQLSIYAELARAVEKGPCEGAFIFSLEDSPQTTDKPRSYPYAAQALAEDRSEFLKRLASELGEIRKGRFPIVPEDGEHGHCSYCAFAFICRKSHGPSRTRALQVRP